MNRGLALAIALTFAAPAAAQDNQQRGPTLGAQIHRALAGDGTEPAATGALIRDAVNSLGGICLNVTSYQIFRRTPDSDTLKVECQDKPLYLLSIDDQAHMLLSGGDGRVQQMDREDGDVVMTGNAPAASAPAQSNRPMFKLPGESQNDAIPESAVPEDQRQKPQQPSTDASTTTDDADPRGWTRWAFAGLLATFGLVAVIGYSQLKHHARMQKGVARVGTYTSEEKDKMLAESAELKPDFYIHPSGLFIVRGRRGKRRLFPNRLYAYLYWRWGLKVAQVR